MAHIAILAKIIVFPLGVAAAIQLYQYYKRYQQIYLKVYGYIICFTLFNMLMTMGLFYIFANLFPRFQSHTALVIEAVYCFATSIAIIIISYLYVLLYRNLLLVEKPDKFKKLFYVVLGLLSVSVFYFSLYSVQTSNVWPISNVSVGFILTGNYFNIGVLISLYIKKKKLPDARKRIVVGHFSRLILLPYGLAMVMFLSHVLWNLSNEVQNLFRFFYFLSLFGYPIFFLKGFMKAYLGVVAGSSLGREKQLEGLLKKYNISNREWEVIQLICEGKTNKQIEEILFISLQTVKDHVSNIYQKTGVKNRVQLNNLFRYSGNQLFS